MTQSHYRYVLDIQGEDKLTRGQFAVEPDWYPAVEAAHFRALRQGKRIGEGAAEQLVPCWDAAVGAPYVKGIRSTVTVEDGTEVHCEIPLSYFRPHAREAATQLVTSGHLKEGEIYLYAVAAYASSPPAAPPGALDSVSLPVSPINGTRPLCEFQELGGHTSASEGVGEDAGEDFPVFIPEHLYAEATALKEAACENETGGILIGYLHQDTDSAEVFAEITALVPARHTVATSTKLTFTFETWCDVQSAIDLRRRGESALGWFHTHPSRYWCKCPPDLQRNCPLGRQFFSTDDMALHRTVFHRAHHLALVVGDRPAPETGWETTFAWFGWRGGVIASRDCTVLDRKKEDEMKGARLCQSE